MSALSVMNEPLTHASEADFLVPTIDSTGLLKLLDTFEIKPGGTAVKLPAFTGYIFDNELIKSQAVTFNGVGSYTPAYLATNDSTYVLIDSAAELNVQHIAPNDLEKQQMIYLCEIQHPNGIVIGIIPGFDYIIQEATTLGSTIRFLNAAIRGCKITPNGANMNLDRQSGMIMLKSGADSTRANVVELPAVSAYSFVYTLQNDTLYTSTNTIDPDHYDNGGVLSSVPPGMFTIQRISITFDGTFLVQYGNQVYASMSTTFPSYDKIDVDFPKSAKISSGATFAYLSIQQGTSNLQLVTQSILTNCNNFGEVVQPTSESSGTALLAANNLSDVASVSTARTNLGAGAANGLATLDATGKLTASQMQFGVQSYGNITSYLVSNTNWQKIMDIIMNSSTVGNANIIRIQFYAEISDRNLLYKLDNETSATTLASNTVSASGFQNITVAKPAGNALLSFNVMKNSINGSSPIIKGLTITYEN